MSDRRCRLGRFYKVARLWASGKTEHLLNAKDIKIGFFLAFASNLDLGSSNSMKNSDAKSLEKLDTSSLTGFSHLK